MDTMNLEQLLFQIAEQTCDAICVFSEQRQLVYANNSARDQFGLSNISFGQSAIDAFPESISNVILKAIEMQDSPRSVDVSIDSKSGDKNWFELSVQQFSFSGQNFLICTTRNIDARKKREVQLEKKIYTDDLSGLSNRRQFRKILDDAEQREIVLGLLDVDHFKIINDRFGHAAGDAAIRFIATKLIEHFGSALCVARLGGEEFGVVLDKRDHGDAADAFENYRRAIQRQRFFDNEFEMTVSVGVAFSRDADSIANLFENADQALYRSKHEGRNRVTIFDG